MSHVVVYRTSWCPYCQRAEALLKQKQQQLDQTAAFTIELIDVEQDPTKRPEMQHRSGRTSVPQIFINEKAIGGYDQLATLERDGQLTPLLVSSALNQPN